MQIFYTVRPGDTVFQLALNWEIPIDSLIAANNLLPTYTIYPDQQLSLPPGVGQMIPPAVSFYVVQLGDTLFGIAARYNVVTDGVNRYDLIRQANNLASELIFPGMRLRIPYAPPGGPGLIAYIANRGGVYELWLYDPRLGANQLLNQGLATANSTPYWSADSRLIAFVGTQGVIFVIDVKSKEIARIDQIEEGALLAWSSTGHQLVYTKQDKIYIYDVLTHQFQVLNRPGASQAQLFPDGSNILYARANQIIKERYPGGEIEIITTQDSAPNNVRLASDGTFVLFTFPGVSISMIRTVEVNTRIAYDVPGGPLAKDYFPVWSPDSNRLAFSSTAYKGVYYSLIRTAGRRGEQSRTWAISDCFATPVTWSPDGNKLAYLSGCNETEFASQLWIIDLRHPVPMLAVKNVRITALQWSPTATSLA